MDMESRLEPWMLAADWREDMRAFVTIDLAAWPADAPLDPLPPVPVLAFGPPAHPLAHRADVLDDPDVPLASVAARIAAAPRASAVLVDLLRATAGMAPEAALTAESLAFAALQGGAEHARWLATRRPASPLPPGTVDLERTGGLLGIRLNRPGAHNAIDRAMRDALFDAFTLAALDLSITRLRLTGAGRCFSLGADLAEFGVTRDPVESHAIRARTLPARALLRRPEVAEAHVHGGCVGSGLELAAFAHRLTASAGAWFQLPETAMGILAGAGGCVSLPRRIGRQRAAALMLSGKRIGADTALRWGLVDAIMDDPPAD